MLWSVLVYLWPVGVVFGGCHYVVFVLANVAGQVRQCGEGHDLLPLAVGGLLYHGVCSWVVWPGVDGSGSS